jgi:uncharacterized protein YdeI (YjbR/CyaY-like superfamily)
MSDETEPTFFPTPADFRAWLAEHHTTETMLWVGFHKKGSGRPSITWPEAVDEALCFGWIDGVRLSVDAESYKMRFTPRKATSTWSAVNIRRATDLIALGRMQPAGLRAFEARRDDRSGIYAYEQPPDAALTPAQEAHFRVNQAAWGFFQSQAAWYRRTATWWVISAKQEATRDKRLATLIADSAAGRVLRHLSRKPKASDT